MRDVGVELLGLSGNFVVEGMADGGGRVEILKFDLFAELFLSVGTEGYVHVAAELAFLHVGGGDAAVNEDLLDRFDVGEGFLGSIDVRVGDELHEGGAGAVVVDDAGVGEVGGLGDVLLEVNAGELHGLAGVKDLSLSLFGVILRIKRNLTSIAEGEVELRDLVVFGHVRVEVGSSGPTWRVRGSRS